MFQTWPNLQQLKQTFNLRLYIPNFVHQFILSPLRGEFYATFNFGTLQWWRQRQSWTCVHTQTSRIHATTSKTVPSSNALWAKSFSKSLIAIQERDRSTHPYLTNKNSTFSPPPRRNAKSNPTKLGMVIENLQHVPTAVPLKRSGVPRRPIVLPKRPFTDRSTDFFIIRPHCSIS